MVWVDEKYECEDGHALFTDSYFIVLCPPKEEIVLRSPSVFSGMPALSPSTTIGEHCKDTSYKFLEAN